MVDSRRLGYEIDSAIDAGRDNNAVRADVEEWCEHLNVELLGVSLLGQMVGVPIGLLAKLIDRIPDARVGGCRNASWSQPEVV